MKSHISSVFGVWVWDFTPRRLLVMLSQPVWAQSTYGR